MHLEYIIDVVKLIDYKNLFLKIPILDAKIFQYASIK